MLVYGYDGTGIGQGFISFNILPKAGVSTGTEIRNVAEITFDGQAIIATNQVDPEDPGKGTDPAKEALITIDDASPASAVLQETSIISSTELKISWSGSDVGSGIQSYTIYVAANGGDPAPLLEATTETEAVLTVVPGTRYSFYSVATDNVGNTELPPLTADLEIVAGAAPTVSATSVLNGLFQRSAVDQLSIGFDQIVEFDASPSDAIQIVHVSSGDVVDAAFEVSQTDNETSLAVSFLAGSRVDSQGVLADGNYQLTIDPNRVSANGVPLDGGGAGGVYQFAFHRLAGDANGDRQVTRDDISIVIAAQGSIPSSGNWNPNADVDGDGRVSVRDRFLVLRGLGNELLAVDQGGGVANRFDTSGDGAVSALDALRIINHLANAASSAEAESIAPDSPNLYDVSRDGRISALDALNVINHLAYVANLSSGVLAVEDRGGEREAVFQQNDLVLLDRQDDAESEMLELLAQDQSACLF